MLLTLAASAQSDRTEYEALLASYGTLRTIAGMGEQEDGNFWVESQEGADARSVELSNPHMTMADAAGNYYIADKESHSILKVNPNGKVSTWAGTHEQGYNGDSGRATEVMLDSPNGLYVFPNGTLFILDFLNRRVRRVDREGNLSTVFAAGDFGPGRALWVSPDEDLIYINGADSVQQWTPEGGVKVVVSAIADPGNLTVDPEGRLVVTSRGDHVVYRVQGPEELEIIAGNGTDIEVPLGGVPATEVGLEFVRAVAFLPNGAYFVATQKGGDVWYVDTQGIIHPFVPGRSSGNERSGEGESVSTPGDKISEPRAVTVAPNGNVVITTNDKGFIRIVERFQTPVLRMDTTGRSIRLLAGVVAGRPYRLEQSQSLGEWQVVESYDETTALIEHSVNRGAAAMHYRLSW